MVSRRCHAVRATGFALAGLLAVPILAATPAVPAPAFQAETLADGVTLFRPVDPGPHGLTRTNALAVTRGDGLLVVGAQPSPAAARELLRSIADVLDRPVRYLVLAYPTAAEVGGASIFPAGALRIASGSFAETLDDLDFDFGGELREVSPSPGDWTGPPGATPDLTLRGSAMLEDPVHPIEIQPAPPAYAPGGLIVELPRDGLIWMGPVLFEPGSVPHADQAQLGAWMSVLNRALTRRVERAVPRQGGVMTRNEIARCRDALAWLRGQVEGAFLHRIPPDEIPGLVLGDPALADHFVLDEGNRARFEVLLGRSIGDGVRERIKRGLDIPE